MNKFAQKLKQLRTDKKLHQKDLANQLTIDQRTVSNWEKGIREPNFDMLIKIAKIFAVSTDYSFIVPTGTMVIHPVRMNGMVIGVPQTFNYFRDVQNRITSFVCSHCNISKERYEALMMETEVLTKDVGSVLEGKETVEEGLICEIGGISQAIKKLHQLIEENVSIHSQNAH